MDQPLKAVKHLFASPNRLRMEGKGIGGSLCVLDQRQGHLWNVSLLTTLEFESEAQGSGDCGKEVVTDSWELK